VIDLALRKYIYFVLFFVLFFFQNIISFSQNRELGSPFIQNIPPRDYGYESQNYSIIQDGRGIVYVANLSGVLEFDGKFWRLIKISGTPRLAIDKNNKIYVGGYNEFGFLAPDKERKMTYYSLISKNKGTEMHFGDIINIIPLENEVLFSTDTKLYRWTKEGGFDLVSNDSRSIRIFKVNDRVYVFKAGMGLMKYSNGNFRLVPHGTYFEDKDIIDILSYNDELLVKTNNTWGFYTYTPNKISIFSTQADDFILKNGYSKSIVLSDGNIAIGTMRNGVVFINENGDVICNINKQNGLNDDEIADLYIDKSNNLWLSTSNGIARVEAPSAFTYFDKNAGVKGGIGSIIRHNGTLYIASTQGLFYLMDEYQYDYSAGNYFNERFFPVKGIKTKCNMLFSIQDELMVSAEDGVYFIRENTAIKASDGILKSIVRSKKHPELVYFGQKEGLAAAKYENGQWKETKTLQKLNKQIRTIAEDDNGFLWMGSDYHGVFRINILKEFNEYAEITEYKNGYGLPDGYDWLDVYSSSKGVLFSTSKGLYRFDYKSNRFYQDTLIGLDFSNKDRWVFPIVEDIDKNIWLSSGISGGFDKTTAVALYSGENEKYTLSSSVYNRINKTTIEAIYPDKNGIVWFGSFDGLMRFDSKKVQKNPPPFHLLIRKIVIGKDSTIYAGVGLPQDNSIDESLIPYFNYKLNSIHFEFVAPSYESEDHIVYQYILEGFDKKWSNWEDNNIKEYTNLSEGEYTFKVRARNIYNEISQTTICRFNIIAPIYRRWYAYLIYSLLIILFIIVVSKWRNYLFAKEKHNLELIIAERTEELVKQKERAEELVLNMLPKDTAEELKVRGSASRKKYNLVTVFFSDVEGFTKIAELMNPDLLIDELDKFFFFFDSVVEKYDIEKIKTIGDAYMCAGGLPKKNRTNPIEVILAALEIQSHMKLLEAETEKRNLKIWGLRIGIHTGPVIAGVVGSKKLSYDIWGDTVNTASRMESSGARGEVNISGETYEYVKDYFICEHRGKIEVKYKGEIDMYFVKTLKPEYSIRGNGIYPNQKFITKLQLIRLSDLEEEIFHKLEKGLPENLYYHNLKHTIDVCSQVELLGRDEGISDSEMVLLKTAALFHDIGFIIGYDDHEELSISMAKETLPKHKYTNEQIQAICDLIFVTKFPPEPKTKLEKIMCDADLDYLGRTDFIPVSQNLFREMYERRRVKSIQEWNKMQLKFIEGHQYFTDAAQKLRNVNKQKQIEELKKMV